MDHPEGNVCPFSTMGPCNHLALRDLRGRSFQINNNSGKQKNRKILLLGVINYKNSI